MGNNKRKRICPLFWKQIASKKDEFQSESEFHGQDEGEVKAKEDSVEAMEGSTKAKKGSVETGEGSMEATGSEEVRESNSIVLNSQNVLHLLDKSN